MPSLQRPSGLRGAILCVQWEVMSAGAVRPDVFGGKPIIRDMRISVEHVLANLAAGETVESLIKDYPVLEPEDVGPAFCSRTACWQENTCMIGWRFARRREGSSRFASASRKGASRAHRFGSRRLPLLMALPCLAGQSRQQPLRYKPRCDGRIPCVSGREQGAHIGSETRGRAAFGRDSARPSHG